LIVEIFSILLKFDIMGDETMLEKLAFDAIDQLRDAKTLHSVKFAFSESLVQFGISSFIICDIPPDLPAGAREIHASGWNKQWEEKYLAQNYAAHDPIPNTVNVKAEPYYWREAAQLHNTNELASKIMNEARSEFRMNEGYCVPIHGFQRVAGLVSMASNEKQWSLSEREDAALHMISLYAYEAVRKIRGRANNDEGGPKLSPREIETVKWVSVGKTSWEIGMILGITENTVSEYIKTASRKLGTCSRAHLVARAHRLRIIN
jgi:LuxR family transcriptional regulator, quorum-sensing system regulator BjaR1